MDGDNDHGAPPFWLQSETSFRRSRSSRGSANRSGAEVVALIAAALVLVFFVVPSVLSVTSQIFRPNVVKRSWDSLNVVLVLFAILCGFLNRNSTGGVGNESPYGEARSFNSSASLKSNTSLPRDRWLRYSGNRAAYGRPSSLSRMSSSSSYPDLRHDQLWVQADDRRQFSDDTNIYRSSRWADEEEDGHGYGRTTDTASKTIHVDKVEVREKEVSVAEPMQQPKEPLTPAHPVQPPQPQAELTSPAPPGRSSTPSRAAKRRPKRCSESIVESHVLSGELEHEGIKIIHAYELPPPSPPPPPPLPVSDYYETLRSGNSGKKRGGSVTKDIIKSLGRKKKQRQRSIESFESFFAVSAQPQPQLQLRLTTTSPPPPPPPLPPPPSVFHNLFSSKKSKSKMNRPHPPVPPPPPPPPSRAAKPKVQAAIKQPHPSPTVAAQRPPSPTVNTVQNSDLSNLVKISPLIPIPPPPPPPPFKIRDWKFSVRGGYVRIRSGSTSKGSSPDLTDDGQDSPGGEMSPSSVSSPSVGEVTEPSSPAIFCPSPDVDTKADNYIARFRAGLQLEKMNSLKRTRSNLGPGPDPNPQS